MEVCQNHDAKGRFVRQSRPHRRANSRREAVPGHPVQDLHERVLNLPDRGAGDDALVRSADVLKRHLQRPGARQRCSEGHPRQPSDAELATHTGCACGLLDPFREALALLLPPEHLLPKSPHIFHFRWATPPLDAPPPFRCLEAQGLPKGNERRSHLRKLVRQLCELGLQASQQFPHTQGRHGGGVGKREHRPANQTASHYVPPVYH